VSAGGRRGLRIALCVLAGLLLVLSYPPERTLVAAAAPGGAGSGGNTSALSDFSSALGRLVTLVAAAGGALLALVWTRVALSWFSNDVAKKVQAKDRARDALVGTLLFAAAVSGLVWGLAQWVVGGG
jgi:hypothetical protein